jgi:hypothetical protein
MPFLEIKHTVWQRIYVDNSTCELFKTSTDKMNDWPLLIDEGYNFEWLTDESEFITPEENDGQATVVLYDQKDNSELETIWSNRDPAVVRSEKIQKLLEDEEN